MARAAPSGRPMAQAIADLLRGLRLQQHRADGREIVHMGTKHHGDPEGCGLEDVVATNVDEAAADEGYVSGAEEDGEFAHRIAEKHGGVRLDGNPLGAAHHRQPGPAHELGSAFEALRMARHQHEQGIGERGPDLPVRREDRLLLALVGTGRHPDRAAGAPLAAHHLRLLLDAAADGDVELHAAGDPDAVGRHPQRDEALRVGLGLRGDGADRAEGLPREGAKPRVAAGRPLGQPAVGEQRRDAARGAVRQQVGPDLRLDHDQEAGPHPVEEAVDGPGQVEREIDVEHLVAEQLAQPRRAGRRRSRDRERQGTRLAEQPLDQRLGRLGLADRHGVHPDPAGIFRRLKAAEALPPAPPVGRGLAAAPQQPQQSEWQREEPEQGVEASHHLPRSCWPARCRSGRGEAEFQRTMAK